MKVTILLGCCLVAATQAQAADKPPVLHEDVYVGDLRQDTPAGLAALYVRVRAAAQRVCEPLESLGRLQHFEFAKCKREAIDRVAAQIPALANYDPKKHKSRNG
jgi:UrcA family protein